MLTFMYWSGTLTGLFCEERFADVVHCGGFCVHVLMSLHRWHQEEERHVEKTTDQREVRRCDELLSAGDHLA